MGEVYWFVESEKNRKYESIYQSKKEIGRRMYQPVNGASFTLHCTDQNNLEWVVKTFQKRAMDNVKMTELGHLLRLEHSNIVRLREVFETDSYLFMVSEYVESVPILKYFECLDVLNETTMSVTMKQVLSGVAYLHGLDIAHRNLKPNNILITTGKNKLVKITDSAFSKVMGMDMEMELFNGDITFTAPEVLLTHKHGKPVDLWAIGVLLFIMGSGVEPFKRGNEEDAFRAILSADFHFDDACCSDTTTHLRDLVKRLLVVDPVLRLTACQALQHTWITARPGVVPATMLPQLPYRLNRYNELLKQKAEYWTKVESMRPEDHLEKDLVKDNHGVAIHREECKHNQKLNALLY